MFTINSNNVNGNLTNFPIYFDLSDLNNNFFNYIKNNCEDLRVINQSNNEVPFEIVSCNKTTQTGELHFKANNLYNNTDITFYFYYDNPSANVYPKNHQYGSQNVWNEKYLFVSHNGGLNDSTSNENHGTENGGIIGGGANGKIGSATEFDGSNDYIEFPDIWYTPSKGTLSAWINTNVDGNNHLIYSHSDYIQFGLTDNTLPADHFMTKIYNGGWKKTYPSSNVNINQWYYVNAKWDGSKIYSYVNGQYGSNINCGSPNDSLNRDGSEGLGKNFWADSNFWDGLIDEFRIYNTSLSPYWISTEFNNQNSSSTFYTINDYQTQ